MDDFDRYISQLVSTTGSDELFDQIRSFLQIQTEENLSWFVSQYLSSYLQLQQWIWQSFETSFLSSSSTNLIKSVADLNKRLIFHYVDITPETKAALLFIPSPEQIDRIFDQIDRSNDENDPFISLMAVFLENFAYFLHDNPMCNRSIVVDHLDDCVATRYIVTDRYKMYLQQLRQEHPPASIFTNRFLFYVRTCSFYFYSHVTIKAQRNAFNAEDMVRFLADDYLTIVHIHSYHVASWSQDLLGCIAQLIGLMCGCFWWGGVTKIHMPILFPNEKITCNHVEDLIRILGHEPFYQQTKLYRCNDQTAMMDALVLLLILIVQSQDIHWFFRSNRHVRDVIVLVASAALNDEIGLCSYAILGEVLTDEQLKDLKIDERICLFFFRMLESAWYAENRTYKHVPLLYMLRSFQTLSKNDCIQNQTATLNKILLFISISDEYPIAYDIIWALSFNNDIATQIRSQKEFITKLSRLGAHCPDEQLKKVISGILWNLQSHDNAHDSNDSTISKDKFDIMISYSHKDKELCHRLYNELIKRRFRVWIDIDQMHGNVMDAMAQAIEHSKMVIICMSEEYRRSNYCRAEAQYAFQRQRKMVPVLLQKHYKPDGWLLFLIGQLLYVDFTKYEFEKAMEMLLKELEPSETKTTVNVPTVKIVSEAIESKNVLDWTNEHVTDWLMKQDLPQLSELLKDCNGRSLSYLNHYLKNGDLKLILKSLHEDAVRRTGRSLSYIELARFQSMMSEYKRTS